MKGQLLLSLDALSRKTSFFSRKNVHSASSGWARSYQLFSKALAGLPLGLSCRSCGVSGTGGGSAARTVWAQWRASPSPYWSPLLPQEGGLELALGSEHPVPLAVMTPALGSCGDRTAGALQHTLWGLCSLPLGHSALAPVCLTLAVLLLAVRYKADLKFRGINHHYAPVQQILMRQDQGWLLPSLAVISRSKSWPFSNGEDGRRIS